VEPKGGICILLESFLHHDVLNPACRHHISEIVLQAVFGLHDVSKSADIEIFVHFRDYWPCIDQTSFSTALQDDTVAPVVMPWKDSIIEFARHQREQSLPRDDYKELLELSIIFLGGTPSNGIQFRYPGAVHRARWMSRAIYSLKCGFLGTSFTYSNLLTKHGEKPTARKSGTTCERCACSLPKSI
jgi:hypothetical protein